MPKQFRVTRRTQRVEAAHAADLGAERQYRISPDRYTPEMCEALAQHLIASKLLRPDILITVRPIARSSESLVNSVDKMLRQFAHPWGRRHGIGPDREPAWLDWFAVAAPCEASHASHAHINISEELSERDQRDLVKLAKKRKLKLEFTGNSEDWLASKRGVDEHACKVRYAVCHLLRAGSDYRISASQTPSWVRGSRARLFRRGSNRVTLAHHIPVVREKPAASPAP